MSVDVHDAICQAAGNMGVVGSAHDLADQGHTVCSAPSR